jgi:thiamine pyrophosphate-dependent acetolactate synthase large subunit-like protein
MTPPQGPVYLCYDAAFQEDPLEQSIPLPDPTRPWTYARLQGEPAALQRTAELLVAAERPVILADALGRDAEAFRALVQLAERLTVPVVDLNTRLSFPNRHPLNLTETSVLEQADLVLALDLRDLYGPLTRLDRLTRRTEYVIPRDCRIVEIGVGDLGISKWSQDFQQFQQTDLSILADTALAVPELLQRCEALLADRDPGDAERRRARQAELTRLQQTVWQRWQTEMRSQWDLRPTSLPRLAAELWEVIRDEDWVLTANTLENWTRRLWDFDHPGRHPGKSLGTATQIGIALGVALAYRGTDKLVVDIQPDGDLLFDAGALWIATHHQIPLLVVMYNNRAYYNDWEHQVRIARQRGTDESRANIGMEIENPAPDFARLAQAFGWYAEGPIEEPEQVQAAIRRAARVVKEERRPALVDTVTQFRG